MRSVNRTREVVNHTGVIECHTGVIVDPSPWVGDFFDGVE
jgi:hypothetical protein